MRADWRIVPHRIVMGKISYFMCDVKSLVTNSHLGILGPIRICTLIDCLLNAIFWKIHWDKRTWCFVGKSDSGNLISKKFQIQLKALETSGLKHTIFGFVMGSLKLGFLDLYLIMCVGRYLAIRLSVTELKESHSRSELKKWNNRKWPWCQRWIE